MSPRLLLDTCAVIWLFGGSKMTEESRTAISEAAAARTLHVSPFSAWEIATLVRKGRLALTMTPHQWFQRVLDHPGVELAPLDPDVLIASCELPPSPPGDPADRIIIATARHMQLTIVTRDESILAYARLGHVAAMEC